MAPVQCQLVAPSGAENHQREIRQFLWTHRSENETDLVIISGEESFKAHLSVILPLSPHLMELLPSSTCLRTKPTISLPPFSSHVLAAVLEMLYTGSTAIAACQEYWAQVNEVFALININANIQIISGEDNRGGVTVKMEPSNDENGLVAIHENEQEGAQRQGVIRRCYLDPATGMFFYDENVQGFEKSKNNCKNDEQPFEVQQENDENDNSIILENVEKSTLPQQNIAGSNDSVLKAKWDKLQNVINSPMADDIDESTIDGNYEKDEVTNENERFRDDDYQDSSRCPKIRCLTEFDNSRLEDEQPSSSSQNQNLKTNKRKPKKLDIGKELDGNIVSSESCVTSRSASKVRSVKLEKVAFYPCNQCEYTSRFKQNTMKHIENSHESTNIGRLQCKYCPKTLKNKMCLDFHEGQMHESEFQETGSSMFKCKNCPIMFPSRMHVQGHKRKCANVKKPVCDECGKTFRTVNILNEHKLLHTGINPFICDECSATCPSRRALRTHIKQYHKSDSIKSCKIVKPKIHKCEVCSKSFTVKSYLKIHMMSHTGELPFSCHICEQQFTSQTALKRHILIHTGEKQFQCMECEKRFRLKWLLQSHMGTHNKERPRPYSCGTCEKTFVSTSHLNSHMKIHSGDKPFKCDRCDYAALNRITLKTHILTHTGEKNFICDDCGKPFARAFTLKVHRKAHHGEKTNTKE